MQTIDEVTQDDEKSAAPASLPVGSVSETSATDDDAYSTPNSSIKSPSSEDHGVWNVGNQVYRVS